MIALTHGAVFSGHMGNVMDINQLITETSHKMQEMNRIRRTHVDERLYQLHVNERLRTIVTESPVRLEPLWFSTPSDTCSPSITYGTYGFRWNKGSFLHADENEVIRDTRHTKKMKLSEIIHGQEGLDKIEEGLKTYLLSVQANFLSTDEP